MKPLQQLVEEYLSSLGFRILNREDGFLISDRLGHASGRDTWLVWTPRRPALPEDYPALQRKLSGEFNKYRSRYPRGRFLVVSPTLEGYGGSFRRDATATGIELTVPIRFFDSPFKTESNPSYLSAFSPVLEMSKDAPRVPQPFELLVDGQLEREGEDLLPELATHMGSSKSPGLRIVVGPAGMGKSVLFNWLFRQLYEQFQDNKAKTREYPRPIPFIPPYLRQAVSVRADALLDEFLRTDVATPVPRETFRWMLVNGFTTWLFDGLDELYAGDPDFFTSIAELLTAPESKAQILICARDSLLSTCDAFTEFLNEFPPGPGRAIQVYRLSAWDTPQIKQFAWIKLEDRAQRPGEREPEKVSSFVRCIEKSDSLRSLAGVPYYCQLLLDQHEDAGLLEFQEDFALIAEAVKQIVRREEDKGVLSPTQFDIDGLSEWLEEVAFHYYESGFAGLTVDEITQLAELVLRSDLSAKEREKVVTSLVQFPLFSRAREAGLIAFEHELICEYLAGKFMLRRIRSSSNWTARTIRNRNDLADSLIVRYIARHLPQDPLSVRSVVDALRAGLLTGTAFANLLQILLLADPQRDLIKAKGISLEGRDLSFVRIEDRDLRDVSLRNCDLNHTTFRQCDLRGAHFEGAFLTGTSFDQLPDQGLAQATFGPLQHFNFIFVDGREIDQPERAADWVREVTGRSDEIPQPCPAARQMRALFLKFVDPTGAAKRDDIKSDDLLRGKRHAGGPEPSDCVEAARRFGYLVDGGFPGRTKRASGDRYGEIVQFVANWRVSTQLREVLDSVCRSDACIHVPSSM